MNGLSGIVEWPRCYGAGCRWWAAVVVGRSGVRGELQVDAPTSCRLMPPSAAGSAQSPLKVLLPGPPVRTFVGVGIHGACWWFRVRRPRRPPMTGRGGGRCHLRLSRPRARVASVARCSARAAAPLRVGRSAEAGLDGIQSEGDPGGRRSGASRGGGEEPGRRRVGWDGAAAVVGRWVGRAAVVAGDES